VKTSSHIASLVNGEGVTISLSKSHEDGSPIGTGLARVEVTTADGGNSVGFSLSKENRRRLRALIDLMDI